MSFRNDQNAYVTESERAELDAKKEWEATHERPGPHEHHRDDVVDGAGRSNCVAIDHNDRVSYRERALISLLQGVMDLCTILTLVALGLTGYLIFTDRGLPRSTVIKN